MQQPRQAAAPPAALGLREGGTRADGVASAFNCVRTGHARHVRVLLPARAPPRRGCNRTARADVLAAAGDVMGGGAAAAAQWRGARRVSPRIRLATDLRCGLRKNATAAARVAWRGARAPAPRAARARRPRGDSSRARVCGAWGGRGAVVGWWTGVASDACVRWDRQCERMLRHQRPICTIASRPRRESGGEEALDALRSADAAGAGACMFRRLRSLPTLARTPTGGGGAAAASMQRQLMPSARRCC
jgi:hypothetical protein